MTHRKSFSFNPNAKRDAHRDQIHRTELDHILADCQQRGVTGMLTEDDDPTSHVSMTDKSQPELTLVPATERLATTLGSHAIWNNTIEQLRRSQAPHAA